jgi:hypothetical protein
MFYKTLAGGTKPASIGLNRIFPMNLPNALGFFMLGLAMIVAPAIAPPNVALGEVSALWLQFMGLVIFLIGSGGTAKGLAAAWPKPAPQPTAAVPATARADAQSALASTANRAAI